MKTKKEKEIENKLVKFLFAAMTIFFLFSNL